MIKLKNYFSKVSDSIQNSFKMYPVTLIAVAIVTLLSVFLVDTNSDILGKIFTFCIIFFFGSFFTENTFKSKLFKIFSYVVAGVIALVFTICLFSSLTVSLENTITRFLFGYCSILMLLSFFKIIKNNNITFSKYLLNVFENTFFTTITYLVLNLGITLVTLVFTELLLESVSGYLYLREQILLLGLFLAPGLINSITNIKSNDINKFIKNLINFVLLPLVVISMFIIYLYIIKIVFFEGVPSNVIYRILAGLFTVAFPVWNMSNVFGEENKLLNKITNLLPYFFMPFLILEVYSLVVRIADCGITTTRYFGIAFLLLQIIMLALTVIKSKKLLPHTFICAAVIVFIVFISPLNFEKVSLLSQKHMLEKYFPAGTSYSELSSENKQKAYSAYSYLNIHNGEKYIPEYAKGLKDETYSSYAVDTYSTNIERLSFNNENTSINVTSYSKFIEATGHSYENSTKIKLNDENYTYLCEVELNTLLKESMNNNSLSSLYQNCIIKIDETKDFYISRLYVSYSINSFEITYIDIGGYLLVR